MAPNKNITTRVQPSTLRPSPAERRAREIERLSTRQAELKEQAAQRRERLDAAAQAPASPGDVPGDR